jgi:hypothetical protein
MVFGRGGVNKKRSLNGRSWRDGRSPRTLLRRQMIPQLREQEEESTNMEQSQKASESPLRRKRRTANAHIADQSAFKRHRVLSDDCEPTEVYVENESPLILLSLNVFYGLRF